MPQVIGLRSTPGHGSLMEWGIKYRQQELKDSRIDWEALATAVKPGAALPKVSSWYLRGLHSGVICRHVARAALRRL